MFQNIISINFRLYRDTSMERAELQNWMQQTSLRPKPDIGHDPEPVLQNRLPTHCKSKNQNGRQKQFPNHVKTIHSIIFFYSQL
jgi:hypothetical protein